MTARDMAPAALVSVIWGVGFVAIKFGLESFAPPQLTAFAVYCCGRRDTSGAASADFVADACSDRAHPLRRAISLPAFCLYRGPASGRCVGHAAASWLSLAALIYLETIAGVLAYAYGATYRLVIRRPRWCRLRCLRRASASCPPRSFLRRFLRRYVISGWRLLSLAWPCAVPNKMSVAKPVKAHELG